MTNELHNYCATTEEDFNVPSEITSSAEGTRVTAALDDVKIIFFK